MLIISSKDTVLASQRNKKDSSKKEQKKICGRTKVGLLKGKEVVSTRLPGGSEEARQDRKMESVTGQDRPLQRGQ